MINGENKLDKVNVAIVGATGAVGEVMLEILAERNFPVEELTLLASERSAGTRLQFQGKSLVVQDLAHFDFSNTQIGHKRLTVLSKILCRTGLCFVCRFG